MKISNIKRMTAFLTALILTLLSFGGMFAFADNTAQVTAATVYVDGTQETDGDGTFNSPYNKLSSAMAAIRTSGGTIVVKGSTVIDTTEWQAGGTVTITGVDPVTGTDYRKEKGTGAALVNRGAAGTATASSNLYLDKGVNTIVLFHIDYSSNGAANISFQDHNAEIIDFVRWNNGVKGHFNVGFNKNASLSKVVAVLDNDYGNFSAGTHSGDGSITNGGIDLTVNKVNADASSLMIGNRGTGTMTVKGDVLLTLNTGLKTSVSVGTGGSAKFVLSDTSKFSVICNKGSSVWFRNDATTGADYVPDATKYYQLTCTDGATAKYGANGAQFIITKGDQGSHAVIKNESDEVVETIRFDSTGTAVFNASEPGKYTVSCANIIEKSITLQDDITFNAYAMLTAEQAATAKMTFEMVTGSGTKTVEVAPEATGNEVEYVFRFFEIAPQLMGKTISMKLEDENGVLATDSTSVKSYLECLLALDSYSGYSQEKLEAMKTLVKDLLVYGGAAQTYVNETAEENVADGIVGSDYPLPEQSDSTVQNSEKVTFEGANVYFDYVNKIRVRFSAEDISGLTAKIDGANAEFTDCGDGTFAIHTQGISALNFSKVFTFSVFENGVKTAEMTYSVNSYVFAKKDSEDAALKDLVLATYAYGVSAEAFQNA
ncbi:MAG: hypothetical protein ACI3XQ_10695 [Eubacteriales bacterium]